MPHAAAKISTMPSLPQSSDQEFVSEPIEPQAGSADAVAMARGEPGVPRRFRWRGADYEIARTILTWKTSTRDRGDLYLRRHWFEIETTSGHRMKIYCQRQAKNPKRPKSRWWLYSVEPGPRKGD